MIGWVYVVFGLWCCDFGFEDLSIDVFMCGIFLFILDWDVGFLVWDMFIDWVRNFFLVDFIWFVFFCMGCYKFSDDIFV